jgi:tetratricopeptide (TPR) repeat protein
MRRVIYIIFCLLIVLSLSSCNETRAKTLNRILNTETGDYENEKISEERIKELEEGIEEFFDDVERVVKANAEIGVYYRMLALEYMDLRMYKFAFDNFEKSMEYYPSNPVLSYYAGICKANIARAAVDDKQRLLLFREAEAYYKAAVKIRSGYSDALYALSVLYMFDFNSPEEARPLLEKLISLDPKNWEAMSLYARYKVVAGDLDSAIDLYNKISEEAWDEEMKEQAGFNRDELLAGRQ